MSDTTQQQQPQDDNTTTTTASPSFSAFPLPSSALTPASQTPQALASSPPQAMDTPTLTTTTNRMPSSPRRPQPPLSSQRQSSSSTAAGSSSPPIRNMPGALNLSPSPEPTTPSTPPPQMIPDDDDADAAQAADLPITVAASVVLTNLPPNSLVALERAFAPDNRKINVRFLPVTNAPELNKKVFAVGASKKFITVVTFLRKKLGLKKSESIFVYVNSKFAPALDEEVGNLFKCFGVKNELVLNYCMTPAFG